MWETRKRIQSVVRRTNGGEPFKTTKGASKISDRLRQASSLSSDEAIRFLDTSYNGLSSEEAEARRSRYGPNEVAQERGPAWYVQLGRSFINPFIGVLVALAVVSLFLDVVLVPSGEHDWTSVIIISIMVTISGLIRFSQEYRSNRAAEELRAMVKTTATVYRPEGKTEVTIGQLVPGDIVQLSAGDMIPADVLLLRTKDLFISQAVLTGESMPVEKFDHAANTVKSANKEDARIRASFELPNVCFMGTNVESGTGRAMVVATGSETYFGSMASSLVGQRAQTSFDRGINSVSWLLIRFMLVMVPVIFFINGFTKGDWVEALLFGLSVAVGLTPEMLPMIVTANLAKGAVSMAHKKTVVKNLNAIQNFGAMDVLCTDKTGTLTQDKITLVRYLDIHGNKKEDVLRYAYLNSHHQTGLKNLLDVAVLEHKDIGGLSNLDLYSKIDEIPFDFVRKRMSVVLSNGDKRHIIITKGAVEKVLSICSFAEDNGTVVPLAGDTRQNIRAMSRDLNEDGLRVLGVAYKIVTPSGKAYGVADESDMVLAGYIGFLDPPKDSASAAIKALQDHGVTVKVLTGDNEVVTRRICQEVGLEVKAVMLGQEVELMTDDELALNAERTTVFARLTPLQKSRIIKALQHNGHTVGFLGDGINDAGALRSADVGISVDTATDIAKESADIILLEKDLMVLEKGVVSGRRTFGNIIKYIKMTASSNFGNMLSVLTASAFLPFLPMLPIQILVQNLMYDVSQTSIPWDKVDEEYVKSPKKWDAGGIGRFMVFIGPISSIFDITTFAVLWFVFGATTGENQALFQSGWFVEGLLTQTLIVHMIRTRKIPFVQSRASWPVLALTGTIMAIGLFIPFSPIAEALGFVPLPLNYFPWLVATLASYCVLTQLVKMWYIRRYGSWI
jgi:Mg2+-importing ATPase